MNIFPALVVHYLIPCHQVGASFPPDLALLGQGSFTFMNYLDLLDQDPSRALFPIVFVLLLIFFLVNDYAGSEFKKPDDDL